MLLANANKANATAMDYYTKRLEALEKLLPEKYPYSFEMTTKIVGEGYPITYIEMYRLHRHVKTWVLVVTEKNLTKEDSSLAIQVVPLNCFSSWSKVKRFILLQIQQLLEGKSLDELQDIHSLFH